MGLLHLLRSATGPSPQTSPAGQSLTFVAHATFHRLLMPTESVARAGGWSFTVADRDGRRLEGRFPAWQLAGQANVVVHAPIVARCLITVQPDSQPAVGAMQVDLYDVAGPHGHRVTAALVSEVEVAEAARSHGHGAAMYDLLTSRLLPGDAWLVASPVLTADGLRMQTRARRRSPGRCRGVMQPDGSVRWSSSPVVTA